MLPLVGELAPPHRRATALSIVVSGLLLGILVARVLSGVVTYFTSWRNIYWLSCGLQYFVRLQGYFALRNFLYRKQPLIQLHGTDLPSPLPLHARLSL